MGHSVHSVILPKQDCCAPGDLGEMYRHVFIHIGPLMKMSLAQNNNAASFLFLPPGKQNKKDHLLSHLHWATEDVGRCRSSFEVVPQAAWLFFVLGQNHGAGSGNCRSHRREMSLFHDTKSGKESHYHLWGFIEEKVLQREVISPLFCAQKFFPFLCKATFTWVDWEPMWSK